MNSDAPSTAKKRVLVTRAREDAPPLVELLRAKGFEPVLLPCIEFAAPADRRPLDDALDALARGHRPDYVILASPNAARRFAAELQARSISMGELRWAAVGDSTAETLRSLGAREVLAPREGAGADALLAELSPRARGLSVLLPCAERSNPLLPDRLASLGVHVELATLYRTIAAQRADPAGERALRDGLLDAITFASGSAVRGFAELFGAEAIALAARCKIVCMGNDSAAVAASAGFRVDGVGLGGLAELVAAI